MAYAYSPFVITVICFVCYRLIKKKSAPSNRYTPYDDITRKIKMTYKTVTGYYKSSHSI
ncbi:DUF3951 domain-containing protein [Peribacillus frigoritolerans]|uniref:DUF3951 domain-containing protein n=1 Tax=Peribacillus frigoritolerans TaxID=450367 RepID=UPI00396B0D05